ALLDAETGRIQPPAVTLGLSESHRDARLGREWSGPRGSKAAAFTERTWHPWTIWDGVGVATGQRAASRPGMEAPAYASGDQRPPGAGISEAKVGARGLGGAPALSYEGSPIVEGTAAPPREGAERSLAEAGPRAGKETEGQGAEGEGELQEERQLYGDAKGDVTEPEEPEDQVDLVMEAILLNDTHREPLGDEEPLTKGAEEGLVVEEEEEERRERLTEGKPLGAFNPEFGLEVPELPAADAGEAIERVEGRGPEEPQVNGDVEEPSEGEANPEAGVVKHSSPGSGEVPGGDSPPDVPEAENGNDTETKENVRKNWSEQPGEEKDPASPNPPPNGTTGDRTADERLSEGLKGPTEGDQTPEVLEGPTDAVPERTLSSDKAQESVPGPESQEAEVKESGTPEGIDPESGKEFLTDASEEHSTEDRSQTVREPQARGTEEGALGEDTSKVTSEDQADLVMEAILLDNTHREPLGDEEPLTEGAEEGLVVEEEEEERRECLTDGKPLGAFNPEFGLEVAELPFDSTPEDRLLGDGAGENILEESDQGKAGELTGEEIPALGTPLSTEGQATEEAEGEVPDVRTDPEVEQGREADLGSDVNQLIEEAKEDAVAKADSEGMEGADGGTEGREAEEGPEEPEGKAGAEPVKPLPCDNEGHTAHGEVLVSEGVQQLLAETEQHHGASEEPATDREMPRGKSEGALEAVLPVNPPEENVEGEKPSSVPGEEEQGAGAPEGEEGIKENLAETEELENSAQQNISQIEGEKGETFERTESLGLGAGCPGDPIQERATDQETSQAEGPGHQVTEGEDPGTAARHSDGVGHGREEEPSQIAEGLVDQEAEERLPYDPKQSQAREDTTFLTAGQEVDLGSEVDQPIEEDKEDAVAEDDSEGTKGSPAGQLLGEAAKGCATDEEPPTSEGRGDPARW
ncbi:uncharacterized protein LOC144677649, partial [Cetorhinus maximus]